MNSSTQPPSQHSRAAFLLAHGGSHAPGEPEPHEATPTNHEPQPDPLPATSSEVDAAPPILPVVTNAERECAPTAEIACEISAPDVTEAGVLSGGIAISAGELGAIAIVAVPLLLHVGKRVFYAK